MIKLPYFASAWKTCIERPIVLSFPITSNFFGVYVSNDNRSFYHKIKSEENVENIHQLPEFLMVIPNMVVLLHKNFVLMRKTGYYAQNSVYLVQHLGKVNFVSNKSKFEDK